MIPSWWVGRTELMQFQMDRNPALSYPVTFYRNGVYVGACPTELEYPFTYDNRNNPPWNG